MNRIKDMESLLLDIKNTNAKEYMEEALRCYNIGAFKACINLSFNSLIFDLYDKLEPLSYSNTKAKKIYNDIKYKVDNQKTYENDLIEQLKKESFITTGEYELILIFQKLRHKCSHPSGFQPTAENARFVYHDIIARFLSSDKKLTTQKINEIISSLSEDFYFPSINIDIITKQVKDELASVHESSYLHLIKELFDNIKKGMRNAEYFIFGMSRLESEKINSILIDNYINKSMSDGNLAETFIQLFNINPRLFEKINEPHNLRLIAIIKHKLSSMPESLEPNKFKSPLLALVKLSELFPTSVMTTQLINSYEVKEKIDDVDRAGFFIARSKGPLRLKFIDSFIDGGIRNNSFRIANEYISSLQDYDRKIAISFTETELLRLASGLIKARKIGALTAERMLKTKLQGIPKIKRKLLEMNIDEVEDLPEELYEDANILLQAIR